MDEKTLPEDMPMTTDAPEPKGEIVEVDYE